MRALTHSGHKNFIISICENGGRLAFETTIAKLSALVRPSGDQVQPVDARVARNWSGRLLPGNQAVHVFEAKENLGFAGGVNVTLRQFARDPGWTGVWLLNPDTEADPNAMSALVARARETGAAVVGSRLVFHDSGRVQLYGGRWRPTIARGFNIGFNQPGDAPVDTNSVEKLMTYACGASLYATRGFIDEVGLLDEGYFLYCEEIDWCLRVDPSRVRFANDSTVFHHHGSTIGSHRGKKRRSALSVYLTERNKLILSKRFFPSRYPVIVFVTLILTFQYALSGAWRSTAIALRGWLAGVRGESGPPPFLAKRGKPAEYST